MRCPLTHCRAQLVERVDRLGRLSWTCPWCVRRKAGVCRHCPRPVDGTPTKAYYCKPCKLKARRAYVMKWQRNNLKKVAELARARRWKEKGRKPPKEKMSYAERGRIGGKLGAAARLASIGPERAKEIARKALETRWAKHRARKAQEASCLPQSS